MATTPEPWILLPHMYGLREAGVAAEYTHPVAVRGIREFVDRLPDGEREYREALRAFATRLYDAAAPGEGRYFLDKTPRYHYVLRELFLTFPDARYIFLWRNPLSVISSIVDTWSRGRWNIDRWRGDLLGLVTLVDGWQANSDRAFCVRYEDLIERQAETWPALFSYLELDYDPRVLTDFAGVNLTGTMGDPTGQHRYAALSSEPLDKWRRGLAGPLRIAWCHRYLDAVGAERLQAMGYAEQDLRNALETLPRRLRTIPSDVLHGGYWAFARRRKRAAFRWMAPRVETTRP